MVELKLECLRLAVGINHGEDAVTLAEKFYEFLVGKQELVSGDLDGGTLVSD